MYKPTLICKMNTTTNRQWSMALSTPASTAQTIFTKGNFTTSTPDYYGGYIDYNDLDLDSYTPCKYENHATYILPAFFIFFFVIGILGNSLVLWIIACGVRLRSMTDVCLLNLAVADLLLACTLPFLAHQAWDQWKFGDAMCKVVLGVYHIVLYCGIFFICLMSIDRYLAIVHAVYAMRARTRSFGMIAAGVIWIVGFCASFPDIIFLQEKHTVQKNVCYPFYPKDEQEDIHFWRVFSFFKMNVLGLLVPLLIMGFCYSQILWRLMSSRTSKKQAIRLVLLVVAVFVCCWAPYNVVIFFKALEYLGIYTECHSSQAIANALPITEAVSYSHSCLNPILYVFVGEKFRRHLIRLINRTPCSLCRFIKVLLPQDRASGSMYSQTSSLDERSTAV
ncbi:C-C chemokine receptor type 5 [Boleophthalmus pectinirostris]|uniref:C-C chemokine receptor type 5 n=1 Tax=Boleophthalmus pectinirostris TaxID=150288 RepID=UPI000A1C5D23|nr:C-C chemokine receptor type 5 [Boleophthalmus pectinirostris]